MFESVLLPAPFSPSSACTSPRAASKSTPSFATTPGNRFVIPRIATAGAAPGSPAPLAACSEGGACCPNRLARRLDVADAADPALPPALHRIERRDPGLRVRVEALALGELLLACLVEDRSAERVPRAGDRLLAQLRDRGLGPRGDRRAVWSEPGEAVLDRAVV